VTKLYSASTDPDSFNKIHVFLLFLQDYIFYGAL